jgi:hypothetical protein
MDNCIYDLILDLGGDENAARAVLIKRGFVNLIHFPEIVSVEKQKEYLEKNQISYGQILNGEHDGLYVKQIKEVQSWINRIQGAINSHIMLSDTSILLSSHYGSPYRMHKNKMQKIKKAHLHASLDIDCSILHNVSIHTLRYNTSTKANNISKFVQAVLESYKRSGTVIDSTKDFKKLIALSDNFEYLQVKFFDEAQAAEFIIFYGDTIKKK